MKELLHFQSFYHSAGNYIKKVNINHHLIPTKREKYTLKLNLEDYLWSWIIQRLPTWSHVSISQAYPCDHHALSTSSSFFLRYAILQELPLCRIVGILIFYMFFKTQKSEDICHFWLSDFAFVLGYKSTTSDIENQTVLSLEQKEGTASLQRLTWLWRLR